MRPTPLFITVTIIGIATLATNSFAQKPAGAPHDQFIVRKGNDTVALEVFSRDKTTLTSDIAQTNGPRTQYTMNVRPDAAVQHVELNRQTRAGGGVSMVIDIGDSSVNATLMMAGESQQFDAKTGARPIPFLAISFALAEQIVRASRLETGKSMKWTALRLGVGDTATMTVTRFHADSVSLAMSDVQLRVAIDASGAVIGGRNVLQDFVAERKKTP